MNTLIIYMKSFYKMYLNGFSACLNGLFFGVSWEILGTNHAWSYNHNFLFIASIPVPILIGWSLYSLVASILKIRYLPLLSIAFTILDLAAQGLGFWSFDSLNTGVKMVLFLFLGYSLIGFTMNLLYKIQVRFHKVRFVLPMLSFLSALLIYLILSIFYNKSIDFAMIIVYLKRCIQGWVNNFFKNQIAKSLIFQIVYL